MDLATNLFFVMGWGRGGGQNVNYVWKSLHSGGGEETMTHMQFSIILPSARGSF